MEKIKNYMEINYIFSVHISMTCRNCVEIIEDIFIDTIEGRTFCL